MKQFEEKGAQLLGLSVDTVYSLRTWSEALGGIRHPLLSDFWPHGATLSIYGLFNEKGGTANRAVLIIDKKGVVRFKELYKGVLPDPRQILDELDNLGA